MVQYFYGYSRTVHNAFFLKIYFQPQTAPILNLNNQLFANSNSYSESKYLITYSQINF